jgi:hypothetical protein
MKQGINLEVAMHLDIFVQEEILTHLLPILSRSARLRFFCGFDFAQPPKKIDT